MRFHAINQDGSVTALTVTQQEGGVCVVEETKIVSTTKWTALGSRQAIREHLKRRHKWVGTTDIVAADNKDYDPDDELPRHVVKVPA